jgi:hypothetical protein
MSRVMLGAAAAAWLTGCAADTEELRLTPASEWRVTKGQLDGKASVSDAKFRAVVPASDGNVAELRFVDRGRSPKLARLASGAMRRQIGLKLRAEDGCNLVYVMWRLEPEAELVVSVKRNPGMRTSAECGANGYRNLGARAEVPASPLRSVHVLRARISGSELRVWTDGVEAWQGALDGEALALDGPVGVRSDNGRFDLALRVRPAAAREDAAPVDSDEE